VCYNISMKSLKVLFRIGYGPSSSHTMGPVYACEYIKKLYPNSEYKVILYGSLAMTGKGHFTDRAIKSVLGLNTIIEFDYTTKTKHPNTMDIIVNNNTYRFESVGGGEIVFNNVSFDDKTYNYPFRTFNDIKEYALNNNMSLPEVVYHFDAPDIKKYLYECYKVMMESIDRGLNTNEVLPGSLKVSRKAKIIFENSRDHLDKIMAYSYAAAEENACGNKIVTAPTCGSCGIIPATLKYLVEKNKLNKNEIVDLMAVGGLIGNVIKEEASLSGAHLGCQAEIGSAASMAAAMYTYYYSKDPVKVDCAAEIAMEHSLGLTCDPIDGYVQIPCIERNAIFSLKAYNASRLSLKPIYPEKISFDSVVNTMKETGIDIKDEYKETSKAGLAKTKIR